MGWRGFDDWGYYKPSKPRKVKGGIRAQSRTGSIGSTWWSKRWIGVLESFGWSNRLERGRRYARSGQVMDFELDAGGVTARVQGSRPKPYKVQIKMKPLKDRQWDTVIDAMASEALFAAKLLAGEMPEDIERVFAAAKLTLFPESEKDIATECSCPDFANPCKHIAAVYYILAEEFDRDPFLLFRLRGRMREDLIAALRDKRSASEPAEPSSVNEPEEEKDLSTPLEACLDSFWKAGEKLGAFRIHIAAPAVPEALLKRLGTPSFWKGPPAFGKVFGEVYRAATERALEAAYGGADPDLSRVRAREKIAKATGPPFRRGQGFV